MNDGNGSDAGHVRVYDLVNGSWIQVGEDIDGEAAHDESGFRLSMSSDGSSLAIGARKNDGSGDNAGHVRIYEYANGNQYLMRKPMLIVQDGLSSSVQMGPGWP